MDTIIRKARSALGNAEASENMLKSMGFEPAVGVEISSDSLALLASAVFDKLFLVFIAEWTPEKRTAHAVEEVGTEFTFTNVNIGSTSLADGNYMLLPLSI